MPDRSEIKSWTIYKITNPIGQVYVGCTSYFIGRISNYKRISKSIERQRLLYQSLIKYQWHLHVVEILDVFDGGKDFAAGKEIFWIRSQMSNVSIWPEMLGLNLTKGGNGAIGCRHPATSLLKTNPPRKGKAATETQLINLRKNWCGHVKPILQYDLNGNFIAEYPSLKNAISKLKMSGATILKSAKHKEAIPDFIFKYK